MKIIQFYWTWRKYFLCLSILTAIWANHQIANGQNLLDELHYVYSDLDSSETSTGILINRTYGGPIERFQGKSRDSTASRGDWFQDRWLREPQPPAFCTLEKFAPLGACGA